MRASSFAFLAILIISGCGLDGPPPQEAKEAAKPAAPAGKSADPTADKSSARTRSASSPSSPANGASTPADDALPTLSEARRGFTTKLVKQESDGTPVPTPPAGVMQLVKYESPAGSLKAYLTPAPTDGKKHPAIIWITGGDCNSIGDCWTDGPPENDQTVAPIRKSGVVVMFASLRGGNDNPGYKEGMFGELDDIVAAAAYLAKQDYVDSKRIYLGGHSTGGTTVLLAAEYSDRFRAVFSFGPVASIANYGGQFAYHDLTNKQETLLRSPAVWLRSILMPTFVIEGTSDGNLSSLQLMARMCKNPLVHFLPVNGATHFSVLAPVTKVIAEQILHDTGGKCAIDLTEESLNKAFTGATEPSPRASGGERRTPRLSIDEKENTAAGISWNKDFVLSRPDTIGFHVTSQGRFAVTIVTDKGYKALQEADEKAMTRQDIVYRSESQGFEMKAKVALPAGKWWFIIENRSDTAVDFNLKCDSLNE
jgi:pimeloyl-ACP methyl ester carboxylesterase